MAKKHTVEIEFEAEKYVDDFIKYLENVDQKTREELDKRMDSLKKETKSVVKSNLRKGRGVRKGEYKKSIVINTIKQTEDEIHFQVGSKKHYRLTHLLENGHQKWVFRRGGKRKTYRGNYGMVNISPTHGVTKKVGHIAEGQRYAENEVENIYESAIKKGFEKGGN